LGQKVHPTGFRLGIIRDWTSKWYAEGEEYTEWLHEDLEIKRFLREEVGHTGISRIEIERMA
jgi:small subunit ribosomal protein S3